MFRRRAARRGLVLATLALSACGTMQPQLAADQPTALVRFKSDNTLGRFVFSYDNERCQVSPSTGQLGTTGGLTTMGETSTLGMLDTPPRSNQVFERRIAADREFVFSWLRVLGVVNNNGAYAGSAAVGCSGTFAARLQPGAQYESSYSDNGGRCAITLSRLERGADGQVVRTPEPSFHALPALCGEKYR